MRKTPISQKGIRLQQQKEIYTLKQNMKTSQTSHQDQIIPSRYPGLLSIFKSDVLPMASTLKILLFPFYAPNQPTLSYQNNCHYWATKTIYMYFVYKKVRFDPNALKWVFPV